MANQNYGIINPILRKKCDLVALLTILLIFVVTQMIPQKILNLLSLSIK